MTTPKYVNFYGSSSRNDSLLFLKVKLSFAFVDILQDESDDCLEEYSGDQKYKVFDEINKVYIRILSTSTSLNTLMRQENLISQFYTRHREKPIYQREHP